MKKIIPTILSLLIILAAILWIISGDNSVTPEFIGEKETIAAGTEKSGNIPFTPSVETIAADIGSSDSTARVSIENANQEKTSASVDIAFCIDRDKKSAVSTAKTPVPATQEIPKSEIIADNSTVSTESKGYFPETSEFSNNSKSPESERKNRISGDTSNVISMKKYTGTNVSDESDSDDENFLTESVSNQNDIEMDEASTVRIPERNWPDSNRVRRELTDEIVMKYPYEDFNKRKIENNVWDVGEQLTFSVDYGFYRAGTATMSILGTEEANGFKCYHIRTEARSNKFISSFYKVRDSVNTFIDVDGIFSRRFEKKLREGNYKSDRIVDFYPNRLVALNTREKYAVIEIPLYTQDILSSLYLLRTFDIEVGKDETIDVYAEGKVYPLKVIIHGIEKVKVPAGKFRCFKIEPILKSEGIFRQKGRLLIWLTCDDLKLPVKMKSKVTIGSITSNLEKYTTGVIE